MKAVILKDKVKPGEEKAKLYYEDFDIPKVGQGEVLVQLKAAAVNRRDIYVRYGLYPGIKVPSVPGSDGAGVIVEVGENVEELKIGQEVVINPAVGWGDNLRYPKPSFTVLGVPNDGTYAEYIKISEEQVFQKPPSLSWKEAAALPLGGLTAYRAVFTKGDVQAGETVIIPGIGGGVATFALQLAVAKGAKVYVTSSSDEKLEKAMLLGASGGVNYRSESWVKELNSVSGGADLLIDSIGGDTFRDLVTLAKPGAKIVSFGATKGVVNKLLMPRIFFKQLTIMGTTMGNNSEFRNMLQLYDEKKIKPVIDKVYDLKHVEEAHQHMELGKQFGKIVLNIQD